MASFCQIALLLLGAVFVWAQQDWQTATNLPALDTTGLTAAQKGSLLKLLRAEGCGCGCGMKIAECRVKDPGCGDSRTLAAIAVEQIKAGKTPAATAAALRDSDLMKARRAALLGEPVALSLAGAPSRGPANARITIVEFSDFQCPYCRVAAANVYKLMEMYPNDIRLVFRQFPLDSHSQAAYAAQASLAAHAQGKFWPMHDKMFAKPKEISQLTVLAWAKELGLDLTRFSADLKSGKYRAKVDADVIEGVGAGVQGTPTFFINGRHYRGRMEIADVKPVIDSLLK